MSEQYSFYDGTAGADEQDAIAGGAFSGGNDCAIALCGCVPCTWDGGSPRLHWGVGVTITGI